jgi:hypothetical protein
MTEDSMGRVCLGGALIAACAGDEGLYNVVHGSKALYTDCYEPAYKVLSGLCRKALVDSPETVDGIALFNDLEDTTYDEVLRVAKEADEQIGKLGY